MECVAFGGGWEKHKHMFLSGFSWFEASQWRFSNSWYFLSRNGCINLFMCTVPKVKPIWDRVGLVLGRNSELLFLSDFGLAGRPWSVSIAQNTLSFLSRKLKHGCAWQILGICLVGKTRHKMDKLHESKAEWQAACTNKSQNFLVSVWNTSPLASLLPIISQNCRLEWRNLEPLSTVDSSC